MPQTPEWLHVAKEPRLRQNQPLDQYAGDQNHAEGDNYGQEIVGLQILRAVIGNESAHHVELSMGKIDDAQYGEDQRESERD